MTESDSGATLPGQRYIVYALQIAALTAAAVYILSNVAAFLSRIQTFVGIGVAAVFFAYAIAPAVAWLERSLPKRIAIATVYVCMVLALAIAGVVIVPGLLDSAAQLHTDIPQAVTAYHEQVSRIPLVAELPPKVHNAIVNAPERTATAIGNFAAEASMGVVGFGLSAASFVAFLIVVPVLAIYLLLEADTIRRAVLRLTPPPARLPVARVVREIDSMLGGFIRGQLTVALIVGAMMTLLLLALHVKYAPLIGVVAGLFDVVPYVGAIAGWLPAFFIALFTNGWQNALLVTLGVVFINQLEGNLIVPRIISAKVGLSPLTVIVALFVGSELLGVLGLLVAVPLVAVFRIVAEKVVDEATPSPGTEAEQMHIENQGA
ncbi:MAG TPA: AI-2E family transporter [Candidatus Baltobacteraceae bacterium]|nr:AI-2E family transporter [Candidatus Baltobacteraceae bacterium]